MNTKRSYLENLNAGRPRRHYASLDDLNRSLAAQGAQIGRWDAQGSTGEEEDIAQRMERLSRELSGAVEEADRREREAKAPSRDNALRTLARDIEHARAQEDGVEIASRIASELKALREDLHRQMATGLKQEFDDLRRDIETAYNASPAIAGRELNGEIERLSSAINDLAERSDDAGVDGLRSEIAHLRGDLDTLAREETVRSVGRRVDAFEGKLAETPSNGIAIKALADRLEEISTAVNALPESLSLRSLEEKVRGLAKAMERFLRQQEGKTPATFEAIEERLDEISRAIVASTSFHAPAQFNPEPFERIEARITSLARQLEELVEDRPLAAVMERLTALSHRVDDIAERAALPEQAVENLARQIAIISDKLDRGAGAADADQYIQGMEVRFAALSDALEQRQADAREQSLALFKDLEERLERYNRQGQASEKSIIKALDARFEAMAGKLADRSQPAADPRLIGELEARLNAISGRIEAATGQIAGIDPDLVRNFESQVSGLTRFLSEPGNNLPAFDDIGPRLETIERSLADNRDHIIKAARQAALDAVGTSGSRTDVSAISGLADDLQSLERLARKSDERNTRTFEAIHDTLLKIVERLGMLEGGMAAPAVPRPAKKALADAPPIEPGESELLASPDETALQEDALPSRKSPASAAMEAARAASAPEAVEAEEKQVRSRSMFVGLARALRSKKQKSSIEERAEPTITPQTEEASPNLDEPLDPALANRPLEPGSGAPDLNAIMKRVRDERGRSTNVAETDAAKSDFIAAARRAAQAAASEAEILKKNADQKSASGRFSLRSLLRANSKTIVLTAGAVLIALAALQLGKAFMQDDHSVHLAMTTPPVTKAAKSKVVAKEPEAKIADSASSKPMSPLANTDAPMKATAAIGPASPQEAAIEPASAPGAASILSTPPSIADTTEAAPAEPVPAPKVASTSPSASAPVLSSDAPAAAASKSLPVPEGIGPAPLRDAAAAGDPKAMFVVATRYAEGDGTAQDMKKAALWYEKAANLGLAPAEYRIGNFYEKGTGVARDIAMAKDWYEKAAKQGNASAMHNLAVLYAMGADGKTDNAAAARWFTAAAELGVKDSQFNLGILSAKGVGVPQNLEESYKWFALVAKTGDRDAAAKRDEVAKALRPEQLTKAKQAVELWKAKRVDQAANVVDIPNDWKDATTTAGIDMKKAVRTIQIILDRNGYDAGSADGVMGDKTKSAIAKFQKDNGMKPTGEVDDKLVHALLAKK
ncbi:MAG TPA: peptidoglycan-binding protein [Rhizobiaceae bacterium]|nr:peptidoglycan-binding protein [Rhizobiaceae bacterium]